MTNKKKILIFIIAFIALIAIGVAIAFVINSKSTKNKESATPTSSSQGSESVANLTLTEAGTIPLGDESANKNDDSGLKVSNGQSSNPANLGSGSGRSQSSPSNSSSSTSDSSKNSSIPGPETFGQYEKYKDAQNSLFGDLQVGTGNDVAAGKKVAVYYKGYLTNGQLFDQSIDKTFVFTVGAKQVIPGWEQSIMGMKVGGVRRMIIPPSVGYGAQGQGPIPGNAVLVFDVQLAAVE